MRPARPRARTTLTRLVIAAIALTACVVLGAAIRPGDCCDRTERPR